MNKKNLYSLNMCRMKKIVIGILSFFMFAAVCEAHTCAGARCNHYSHYNHNNYRYNSSSHPVYLINSEHQKTEQRFPNCDKHYVETETTVNFYSDGTRRVFSNSTIFNSDGTLLLDNCLNVRHVANEDKHYFIVKRYKEPFKIIDSDGNVLTHRSYSYMEDIEPNRIFVKLDKKYGMIDLAENIVVPMIYQKFDRAGDKIFIGKLNGYYGIVDIDNNILVKPECNKIKKIYDVFVAKKYDKYVLISDKGEFISGFEYDKVKKLGEYILVRKNNRYGVYDFSGMKLTDLKYKKIRLERNNLEGQLYSDKWLKMEKKL